MHWRVQEQPAGTTGADEIKKRIETARARERLLCPLNCILKLGLYVQEESWLRSLLRVICFVLLWWGVSDHMPDGYEQALRKAASSTADRPFQVWQARLHAM